MSSENRNGSYYFIGIGGVSMSALARLLHDRGISVRGSDAQKSVYTESLGKAGIRVHIGESELIWEDTVVYTGAISETHPQILQAKREKKRLLSRAELLGKVAEEFPHVLSVAGCHGKTTTTSMLAHIFSEGDRRFTCHIGGEDLSFGNYFSTGTEYFLTEACEFRRSFLSLKSEIAVILNTDLDHTDCYRNEDELFEAYAQFASHAEKLIVNADDPRARTLPHALSFGLYSGEIRAEDLRSAGERYSFMVTERGVPLLRVRLSCIGKVTVYDALAAFSAARLFGFSAEECKKGLERFQGVGRRFESVGTFKGIPVVCDYAHHPKEIAAVFSTAQKICSGTVRLVFQPHTYTRTRDFMEEFVSVLKEAEDPVIFRTFAAREPFDGAGSAYTLVSRLPEAVYVQSAAQLKKRLSDLAEEGDLILVLGAGDIFGIVKQILDK